MNKTTKTFLILLLPLGSIVVVYLWLRNRQQSSATPTIGNAGGVVGGSGGGSGGSGGNVNTSYVANASFENPATQNNGTNVTSQLTQDASLLGGAGSLLSGLFGTGGSGGSGGSGSNGLNALGSVLSSVGSWVGGLFTSPPENTVGETMPGGSLGETTADVGGLNIAIPNNDLNWNFENQNLPNGWTGEGSTQYDGSNIFEGIPTIESDVNLSDPVFGGYGQSYEQNLGNTNLLQQDYLNGEVVQPNESANFSFGPQLGNIGAGESPTNDGNPAPTNFWDTGAFSNGTEQYNENLDNFGSGFNGDL